MGPGIPAYAGIQKSSRPAGGYRLAAGRGGGIGFDFAAMAVPLSDGNG